MLITSLITESKSLAKVDTEKNENRSNLAFIIKIFDKLFTMCYKTLILQYQIIQKHFAFANK